jgi:DNA mismatch repair protein MutS
MTIAEDYLNYTAKWKKELGEKTIVLIQVGSFFEVYALRDKDGKITGSDIEKFSNINDMAIAEKTKMSVNGKTVLMAGFGLPQLDKYVDKLQSQGYTIVVYTQDTQSKNTTRSLNQIISPGTYFSPDTEHISNTSMCVWIEHIASGRLVRCSSIVIGVATLDIFTGKSTMFQTELPYYHNPTTYDELERCVTIHKPMECIIVTNMKDNVVNDIISFTSLDNSKLHVIRPEECSDEVLPKHAANASKQTYQQELFKRLYPDFSPETLVTNLMQTHSLALQSFVLLLDFVCEHNPHLISRLCEPTFETGANELVLANHSLIQLNILEDYRHSGKLRSVGSFLNNCVTVMGKRKFSYDLYHPMTNTDKLNESYDVTSRVLETNEWVNYRKELYNIHDIEKLNRKIAMKRLTPKDIALFYQDLQKVSNLCTMTNADSCIEVNKYVMINGDPTIHCKELITLFEETLDLDKCLSISDMSKERLSNMNIDSLIFIRNGMSSKIDKLVNDCLNSRLQLDAIASNLSDIVAKIENKGKSTRKEQTKYVKIHETAKSEPMLMATKRRITLLKSQIQKMAEKEIKVPYLCHDGTQASIILDLSNLVFSSNGTNKKEDIIQDDIIRSITSKVQRSLDDLVLALSLYWTEYIDIIAERFTDIQVIASYVTMIDVLQCKAYIAHKYNYCKPEIIDNKEKAFCSFTGIRHPLIEHIQTNEIYVTNNLTLGDVCHDESSDGLLLYGTNAVGKTSFIKSVGISVIMAQAGLFVPCTTFTYSPYSYIFTRILGNDNLFKGLSTFAVEMSELRTIINLADENSLILGDELCSGTESDSALSIFTAGLESLHEKRCSFMFATHFHEVTHYNEVTSLERLKFAHMEVTYNREIGELIYDRKLKPGSGTTMYGLEVCKSLHLPEEFLERAHNIRMKYNKSSRGVLVQKSSRYNRNKVGGLCEICKTKQSTEVHHLQHQTHANTENGYISTFHKNHNANLINICEACHDKIHQTNTQHRLAKTDKGYRIIEI